MSEKPMLSVVMKPNDFYENDNLKFGFTYTNTASFPIVLGVWGTEYGLDIRMTRLREDGKIPEAWRTPV
jgi:hypothetical protein